MAFWNADLTTQDGAHSAAQVGSLACFIAMILAVLGAIFVGVTTNGLDSAVQLTVVCLSAAQAVIFLVASLRLRTGRGLAWGIVAAALIVVEIVWKLVTLTGLIGLVIDALLLVGILTGVRGARALRVGGVADPDLMADTFR